MSYSAVNIADDYYYRGVENGETHRYSGQNLSYRERDAISYSTIIAKVIPAAGFKDCDVTTHDVDTAVTLVTMDPMSKTTAKHRNLVVAASPFRVICVPLDRGYGDFSPERLRDNFLNELASLKEFNHANVRRRFISVMNARNAVMSCACARWAKPLMSARFRKYERILSDLDGYAAKLRDKARKEGIKKSAETKAFLKKYAGDKRGSDYLEFMHAVCDQFYSSEKYPMTREQARVLKSKFRASGAAYAWISGDNIRTSQGAMVSVEDAVIALKAWGLGHDMRKFMVGRYSVVKYEGDTIQIGCHHIPRENCIALYEALLGKTFPERKEKCGQ